MVFVYIGTVFTLTLAWCILSESFSLLTIAAGALVSVGCVLFARAYLPLRKLRGVYYLRLVTYPFYMLAQIYIAAFSIIKMILTKAKAGIIEIETVLDQNFLKIMLSHCATLTPGTVSLDMDGDKVTLLCLLDNRDSSRRRASQKGDIASVRNIEKRLLWAEKSVVKQKDGE